MTGVILVSTIGYRSGRIAIYLLHPSWHSFSKQSGSMKLIGSFLTHKYAYRTDPIGYLEGVFTIHLGSLAASEVLPGVSFVVLIHPIEWFYVAYYGVLQRISRFIGLRPVFIPLCLTPARILRISRDYVINKTQQFVAG